MTKYMIFGWDEGERTIHTPPTQMLGTSDIIDMSQRSYKVVYKPNGKVVTHFGWKRENTMVTLSKEFFAGKPQQMIVFSTYGSDGVKSRRPVLAYYPIPGTGEDNG